MQKSSFDIVLLDIMIPSIDGYELLAHVKTHLELYTVKESR